MKKVLLALLFSGSMAQATDYYSIINAIAQDEVNKFKSEFNSEFAEYNKLVISTSAAMVAISNIDFNPDHKGWSVGVGLATVHSGYGDGNAYAVGSQYGFKYGSLNIKGAYYKSGEFILGSGFVVGF